MRRLFATATAALAMATASVGGAQPPLRPDQAQFRDIYRTLIETDTSITTGDCTLLAGKIEAMLRAGGYGEADITRFSVPDHPKEGGLVAVLKGTDGSQRPILLLGHLDVVTAKRADWTRDPYTLIEEGGYFYGRGTSDMKDLDAQWIDTMLRLKAGAPPRRTVKMALTCGEETGDAFNGADWLAKNRRGLIDAAFALNEGGGGETDGKGVSEGGRLVVQTIQVGEKVYQDYTFTVTNPGGHGSIPIKDNAIYHLADALARLRDYEFPAELSDTTRVYFAKAGAARGGALGAAMQAIAANPVGSAAFKQAEAVVNTDRELHSMLRTTCIATMVDAGHARNALPQHAVANINCRIFPGHSQEEILHQLETVIAEPEVKVELHGSHGPATPPPLDPAIVGPMEQLAAKHFPGVPVLPVMSTGASDGVYLEAVGIPTYGVPGDWNNPDGNGVHGLNERLEVRALYAGRDYIYDLVRSFAG